MITEQLRERYFLAIRMLLVMAVEIYIVLSQSVLTGAPAWVLLLLALFFGAMAGKELTNKKIKWIFTWLSAVLFIIIFFTLGREFLLLGILLFYEILFLIKPGFFW